MITLSESGRVPVLDPDLDRRQAVALITQKNPPVARRLHHRQAVVPRSCLLACAVTLLGSGQLPGKPPLAGEPGARSWELGTSHADELTVRRDSHRALGLRIFQPADSLG